MLVLEEDRLKLLLVKAYEEGWHGSKDLAENIADTIIAELVEESSVQFEVKIEEPYNHINDLYAKCGRQLPPNYSYQ